MENREKSEKTGCEIICGTPTTLAVKGLMMIMMMMMMMMMKPRNQRKQSTLTLEGPLPDAHGLTNQLPVTSCEATPTPALLVSTISTMCWA